MNTKPTENIAFTGKVRNSRRCKVWPAALIGLGLLCLVAQPAQSAEPANKPAVAINRGSFTFLGNNETVRILQEIVKTSSPTDLLLAVTAESSIITELTTIGDDTQSADGAIRVYIAIDGVVVHPTGLNGPGHQRDGDTAEVVFANQIYRRTTSLDPDSDTITTYLETKHAAGFNWAVLNVGAGTHRIEVFARYNETNTPGGGAEATGVIGNRSLVVQPVKCQVDETVADDSVLPPPDPLPIGLD